MSGAGGKWRIRQMYLKLCERYHQGDHQIDILGFSRGAALAVHFANLVHTHGIRNPRGGKHAALSYDRMLGWSFRMPKPDATDVKAPPIRFLGLWDTVASFGLPVGPLRNRPTTRWVLDSLPANVRHSFHAMALDEVRATFALVRPQPTENTDRHYEVWFRGVHSNIGGGYLDRGLSDIALAWMMEMYLYALDKESQNHRDIDVPESFRQALERLKPEPSSDQSSWKGTSLETLEPNPDGELGRPAEIRRQGWRAIPEEALVHHSVYRRTKNLLLDHYSSNRRLLRQIPGDALPVYDPPFFYGKTPRQVAMDVAIEAFHHIPVRAADWLTVDGMTVVRSDDWLAPGRRREELKNATTKQTFVDVATAWLLNGRCQVSALNLPGSFKDYDDADVPAQEAARWIIAVLEALEPYVPSLRAWTQPEDRRGT
jgi:hypothetical protein